MEKKNNRKIEYLILGFLFGLFVFYCILSPLTFISIIAMNELFPFEFFKDNYDLEISRMLPGFIGVIIAILLSLYIFIIGVKILYKKFHKI